MGTNSLQVQTGGSITLSGNEAVRVFVGEATYSVLYMNKGP